MILFGNLDLSFPLTDPVLKFLVILAIILASPIILNRIKIPHILGLIIAGAFIGPNGFNLLQRDSGIILSGTAGLLYIMFLAGLEIDRNEFKKNSGKSLLFGMYTFIIPMVLGTLLGLYVLHFSIYTSVLLASMFASHTLIAYPLLSNLGVTKTRSVNIAVGGTMITDTLALLVLAIIVGMVHGEVNTRFWVEMSVSILVFGLFVMIFFPIIGRWFFKTFSDKIMQYIFVLAMVFLSASLALAAGIEAIIGAFLAGLALNKLIPSTSPLMNRVEFVGNAVFIPFFLISVGMLVDYRVFFSSFETIKVAIWMTVLATVAKYLAAWATQKSLGYNSDERRIIFGLSNAQAAATLAAVLVGYNIILGETASGEPIRLLNDSVLNGTIVMILVTCTIATFAAQKGGKNLSLASSVPNEGNDSEFPENILIPINNPENIEELIGLSTIIKSKNKNSNLYALNIINHNTSDPDAEIKARKFLEKATITASASDTHLHSLLRYDIDTINGITSIIKEQNITDLVLGLHKKKALTESFLGKLTEGVLSQSNATTLVYKPAQPISTIKRHVVVIPAHAEREPGFPFWIAKIYNISKNTGAKFVFYGNARTNRTIKDIFDKYKIEASFVLFDNWDDFLILSRNVRQDDNLILILSRAHKLSYHESMRKIPHYLNKYFNKYNFILIYPRQYGVSENNELDLNNPSLMEPVERLDELGKTIARLFKAK